MILGLDRIVELFPHDILQNRYTIIPGLRIESVDDPDKHCVM